jgi:hypothetical protein
MQDCAVAERRGRTGIRVTGDGGDRFAGFGHRCEGCVEGRGGPQANERAAEGSRQRHDGFVRGVHERRSRKERGRECPVVRCAASWLKVNRTCESAHAIPSVSPLARALLERLCLCMKPSRTAAHPSQFTPSCSSSCSRRRQRPAKHVQRKCCNKEAMQHLWHCAICMTRSSSLTTDRTFVSGVFSPAEVTSLHQRTWCGRLA